MLVEAGAEMDAKCWDITPLMSAAAGGHYWAVQTLLELGAETNIGNGYQMMALDYARDQASSRCTPPCGRCIVATPRGRRHGTARCPAGHGAAHL